MVQQDYVVAKIGFDTAENEPPKVSMEWNINPHPRGGSICPISTAQVGRARIFSCERKEEIEKER